MPMEIPEAFVNEAKTYLASKIDSVPMSASDLISLDDLKVIASTHHVELTGMQPLGNRAMELTFGTGDSTTTSIVEF